VSFVNAIILRNASISVDEKIILEEVSLQAKCGQTIGLIGNNGSGKSSLAYALAGHPAYTITKGKGSLFDVDLDTLSVVERSKMGLFVSFQQVHSFGNVSTLSFLFEAYRSLKDDTISYKEVELLALSWIEILQIEAELLYRPLYEGFSGGQKRRIELLQLLLFSPRVALLDEIDSGLDMAGLQILIKVLQMIRKEDPSFTLLLISHNPKFLIHMHLDTLYIVQDKSIKLESPDYLSLLQSESYASKTDLIAELS